MNNDEMLKRWGHRLPQKNIPIFGALRIAQGAYGTKIVLEKNIDIEESPWWYDAVHRFIADFLKEHADTSNPIYDVAIQCTCRQDDNNKVSFEIHRVGYTKIPELRCSTCGS